MPGSIQSIERAAAILRLLSGRTRRLGVAELAGELGLAKGTVHGILRTLQQVGFVEQDPDSGKYQLGAALLHMGASYLDGNELRTRALSWSGSLAARTQEAVRVGILHDGHVLIVHHVLRPDDTLQTLDVGALLPAHSSALGKVLLAGRPDAAEAVIAAGLPAYTDVTITDPERLRRELAQVHERGWALDAGETLAKQVSLAAPILDRTGATAGAIAVFGAPERLLTAHRPRPEPLTQLRAAAQAVSRELGATHW